MRKRRARIPGMANMRAVYYDGSKMDGRLAVFAIACGSAIPRHDYSKEPDPRRMEYAIGPSDVLDVNVWNNANISRSSLHVRPDGTITLPLLGDIQATGRTPTQLTVEIKR